MGLWISFALIGGMLVLMGWSVYSTHRDGSVETFDSRLSMAQYLDSIDVLIVLVSWIGVSLVPMPELEQLSDLQYGLLVGLLAMGPAAPAVWLRRRLFPRTVIPFHRNNLGLRCGAVFSGLLSLTALVFGFVARGLEAPGFQVWGFFQLTVVLFAVCVGCHWAEARRHPDDTLLDDQL